jgi:hypothetical protein
MENQALIEIQVPDLVLPAPELSDINRSERIHALMNKILDVFADIAKEIWDDHLFHAESLPPCPIFAPCTRSVQPLCMTARTMGFSPVEILEQRRFFL